MRSGYKLWSTLAVLIQVAWGAPCMADTHMIAWFMQPQWLESPDTREFMRGLKLEQQVDRVFLSEQSLFPVDQDQVSKVFAGKGDTGADSWRALLRSHIQALALRPGEHHLVLYFSSHGVPGHLKFNKKHEYLSYATLAQWILDEVTAAGLASRLTLHLVIDACKSGSAIEIFHQRATHEGDGPPLGYGQYGSGLSKYAFKMEIMTSSAEEVEAQGRNALYVLNAVEQDPRWSRLDALSGGLEMGEAYESAASAFSDRPQYWRTWGLDPSDFDGSKNVSVSSDSN